MYYNKVTRSNNWCVKENTNIRDCYKTSAQHFDVLSLIELATNAKCGSIKICCLLRFEKTKSSQLMPCQFFFIFFIA